MRLIKEYIEDLLILSGITLIVVAAFKISIIVGLVLLGLVLIAMGVLFIRFPPDFKRK